MTSASSVRPTILVIDDEGDLRTLLVELLKEQLKAEVFSAASVKEGIDLLTKRDKISLIVCDYYLQNETGGDLFEYLKKNNLKIPFVLCSGDEPTFYPEFKSNPPDGYLSKPFRRKEALDIVSSLLRTALPT